MAEFIDRIEDVEISRTSRTLTRRGFSTLLVLAYHTLYADRVKTYGELSEMVADGFTPYDAAYQQVAAAFAQEPSLTSVKVGRRALPFTQVVDVTPSSPVSASAAETWTLKVDGLTATFTSDATPTLAEVCTGLAASINALGDVDAIVATLASSTSAQTLTGATLDGATGDDVMSTPRFITFTFSSHADWDATSATLAGIDGNGNSISETIAIPNGGAQTVTSTKRYLRVTSITIPIQAGTGGTATVGVRAPVTADGTSGTKVACTSAAGELHSYELVTANFGGLTTATTNAGIATDLAAVLTADNDWFGLVLDSNGAAEVLAAAAWCESAKKMLGYTTSDQAHLSTGSVTAIGYSVKNAAYLYTFGMWRAKIATSDSWAVGALLGLELSKAAGASHFAFKTLAGQYTDALTDTQRQAIESYNLNHYTLLSDVGITYPGKVASGEWMDVVRDLASLRVDLQYDVAEAQIANDKLAFDDDGISVIGAKIRARLQTATDARILATSPKFVLNIPRATAVPSADRQARRLTGITFDARMAGAILGIRLRGRVAA
jgi:hypothetical protein